MKKQIEKITATVRVYAAADDNEVISAQEFENVVADKAAEFKDDGWHKSEWLESKGISAADVLDMTADERAALESKWEAAVTDMAREYLLDYDWTEHEIEVEVAVAIKVENTVTIQTA